MNSTHARILNVLFIGHDMSCTDQLTERDLRNSRLVHSLSLSLSLFDSCMHMAVLFLFNLAQTCSKHK